MGAIHQPGQPHAAGTANGDPQRNNGQPGPPPPPDEPEETDIEGNGHMAAGKRRVLSDISLLQRWNVLIFSFELNNLAGAWMPQMILEHRINPQPLPARQKKADQQNQKGAALSAFFNLNIAPE